MGNKQLPIKLWSEEEVNQIFGMYLDNMSNIKQNACNLKYITVNDKRVFLMLEQKKFEKTIK